MNRFIEGAARLPFVPGSAERKMLDRNRELIENQNGTEIMTHLAEELIKDGDSSATVIEDISFGYVSLTLRWEPKEKPRGWQPPEPQTNGVAIETSNGKFFHVRFTGFTNSWHYIDHVPDRLKPNSNSYNDGEIYRAHLSSGGKKIEDMTVEEKLRLSMQMARPMNDWRNHDKTKKRIIFPR